MDWQFQRLAVSSLLPSFCVSLQIHLSSVTTLSASPLAHFGFHEVWSWILVVVRLGVHLLTHRDERSAVMSSTTRTQSASQHAHALEPIALTHYWLIQRGSPLAPGPTPSTVVALTNTLVHEHSQASPFALTHNQPQASPFTHNQPQASPLTPHSSLLTPHQPACCSMHVAWSRYT